MIVCSGTDSLYNPVKTKSQPSRLAYISPQTKKQIWKTQLDTPYLYWNCMVIMQGKFFQRCSKHKTDVEAWQGIHLSHKNQWNILVIGNYYVSYQNYQNLMLSTSSDSIRTLMHLFLFIISAQRELVSICTQSIRNCNYLSLHYNLAPCYIRSACFSTAILFHNSSDNF